MKAPLSRTSLERRFRKYLDYSVVEAIHLLKIEHIKQLLVSTTKTMEEIAPDTGLSGETCMVILFREKTGMTPREYSILFRKGGS
ncbi:MAG: helix-turn-helix domain-containing protein [Chthoniobacterales bacterium]